jgi:branched-chain amino acid transport system permease protein
MSVDQAVFEVGRTRRTKPSKISVQRQTVSSRIALAVGMNPFLAVGLSVVLPTLLAVPTYALLHRLDGPYFAIGTWGHRRGGTVAHDQSRLCQQWRRPDFARDVPIQRHEREVGMIFLCVILLLTTVGGLLWLLRSRYGLALTAMRDNPIAAESQGVNVRRLRFVVFVLAAAGSGLAGAIYYMAQLRITPASGFNPQWASVCVFIVMLGGIGSIEGPIIGALIYFIADRFFSQYGATYMIVLGVITVLVALYARGGVWGLICRFIDAPWFPIGRKLVRSPD